jgi:hypothetical protein
LLTTSVCLNYVSLPYLLHHYRYRPVAIAQCAAGQSTRAAVQDQDASSATPLTAGPRTATGNAKHQSLSYTTSKAIGHNLMLNNCATIISSSTPVPAAVQQKDASYEANELPQVRYISLHACCLLITHLWNLQQTMYAWALSVDLDLKEMLQTLTSELLARC